MAAVVSIARSITCVYYSHWEGEHLHLQWYPSESKHPAGRLGVIGAFSPQKMANIPNQEFCIKPITYHSNPKGSVSVAIAVYVVVVQVSVAKSRRKEHKHRQP